MSSILLSALLAAASPSGGAGGGGAPASGALEAAIEGSAGGAWRDPDPNEVARARELFVRALEKPDPALAKDFAALGFEYVPLSADGRSWHLVHESAARREGRGFYVIADKAERPHLLQVPHRDDDLHTGTIGARLAQTGRFKAAAFNTVPRGGKSEDGGGPADLAHRTPTFFTAFADAWAAAGGQSGVALQIHGFDPENHPGLAAEAIVSSGSRSLAPAAQRFGSCLKQGVAPRAALYPDEAKKLGGTTNATGKLLRQIGHAGFIHLEMAAALRRSLAKGDVRALAECLP